VRTAVKRPLVLLSALTLTLVSPPALATAGFPTAVQSDLGLATAPDCALCHVGEQNASTATTNFATAMKCRGVTANQNASIAPAVNDLAKSQPAVIQALKDGKPLDQVQAAFTGDPCAGASSSGPEYGCTTAPRENGAALLGGALVALAMFATRRRRTA